jgi:hypothetical protein
MGRQRSAVARSVIALLVLTSWGAAATAAAQASLTGDFIEYVWTGSTGSMIHAGRSMAYRESASTPSSCDAFFPGAPVEQFTIEATGDRTFVATNTADLGDVVTTDGPRVSGRSILWSGSYTAGASAIEVDQVLEMEPDARLVRYQVTITNTGTTDLRDLYYMRDADPDHGADCPGGSGTLTDNDVVRQFPADTSALVVAGALGGAYYYVGLGTFDERAVVSASGFANTNPSEIYARPTDPEGASDDISIDVVFREPLLPVGASTTFEFFYVWATTIADLEDRFDAGGGGVAGPCDGLPELARCTTPRGASGTCRAGVCCTGCWDGTRCVGGRSGTACGIGGGACRSCADGDACSSDVCTDGVCSNPDAPRGTRCDDGLFCTRTDTCDGRRRCVGAGSTCDDGSACTIDTCFEATDTCTNEVTEDACIIGGECVADGAIHPAYPCLYCDPRARPRDWSTRPEGTSCGEARCAGGRLVTAATCSTTGACLSGMPTRCAVGYCADETTCASTCTDGACPGSSFCAPSGVCELRRANGSSCASDGECASGQCVDGLCCNDACTGTCESCAVPGSIGRCVIVPAMTDPDGECGPTGYCDGVGGCVGGPDAGVSPGDAGAGVDAAGGGGDAGVGLLDGGTTPPGASGCGCRSGSRTDGMGAWAVLGLVALALRRRGAVGRRPAR